MVTPAARREAVAYLQDLLEVSERRACRIVGANRKSVRYRKRFGPAEAADEKYDHIRRFVRLEPRAPALTAVLDRHLLFAPVTEQPDQQAEAPLSGVPSNHSRRHVRLTAERQARRSQRVIRHPPRSACYRSARSIDAICQADVGNQVFSDRVRRLRKGRQGFAGRGALARAGVGQKQVRRGSHHLDPLLRYLPAPRCGGSGQPASGRGLGRRTRQCRRHGLHAGWSCRRPEFNGEALGAGNQAHIECVTMLWRPRFVTSCYAVASLRLDT